MAALASGGERGEVGGQGVQQGKQVDPAVLDDLGAMAADQPVVQR